MEELEKAILYTEKGIDFPLPWNQSLRPYLSQRNLSQSGHAFMVFGGIPIQAIIDTSPCRMTLQ